MNDEIIKKAANHDLEAQEALIRSVNDLVFNLSLRMLGDVDDAKDASQEILMRILDKVHTFRFESAFTTWVYRLSLNYLLRVREQQSRYAQINFEIYASDLVPEHFDVPYHSETDTQLLAEELKYSCSNVMLQCLDERSRCVYVLGTMFHVSAKQGAEILDLTPENYRQILSRTKKKMKAFLTAYCMEEGHCSCSRRLGHAIRTHRLDPQHLQYTSLKQLSSDQIHKHTRKMEDFESQSDFFSELPHYEASEVLKHVIQQIREDVPCH